MPLLHLLYMGPLPPFRGGGGVLGSLLLKALARQGCDIVAVSYLSADEARLDPTLTAAGIRLHAVAVPLETNPWEEPDETYLAEAGRRLQDTVRTVFEIQRPDVLLVGRGDYGRPAMAIADEYECPFVMIDHGSASAHYAGFGRVPESFRPHTVLQRAACVVSVAPHRAEVLRSSGFCNVVSVPNGTDTELFSPGPGDATLRRGLGLRPDTPVVAHVSNIAPVKRVPDYLAAACHLRSAGIDAHFLVVGDGPARRDLEAQAHAFGLAGHITFTGWLSPERLAPLLRSVDVIVHPSEVEACPLSILEAMASGCAVVASDIPGHRENIRHDVTGLLAPVGDTGTLTRMIADLLRAPKTRQALGAAAYAATRHRTADAMASAYRDVLTRATAPARRRHCWTVRSRG